MLIRYCPDEVVTVIDPEKAGQTAEQVLGWGGDIPCVASFSEAAPHQPTHLVIGSAPPGGVLNNAHRYEIENAIKSGCNIISGMHVFLNDDEHFSRLTGKYDVTIADLRRPPKTRRISQKDPGKTANILFCWLLDLIVIPGK